MSTSTETQTATAEGLPKVMNLREAKKAQAAARKAAPAEATPAKAAKVAAPKRTFTATGRCGVAVKRGVAGVVTHAVDVAEPEAASAKAKAGRVWSFFTSEAKAEAAAAKLRERGYDVVIVAATEVTA